MAHSVSCGACNASFSIPDDVWEKRVQDRLATLKCRHCKAPIVIDGRTRRGSSATSSGGKLKAPAGSSPASSMVQASLSSSSEAAAGSETTTQTSRTKTNLFAGSLDAKSAAQSETLDAGWLDTPFESPKPNIKSGLGHASTQPAESVAKPQTIETVNHGAPKIAAPATRMSQQLSSQGNQTQSLLQPTETFRSTSARSNDATTASLLGSSASKKNVDQPKPAARVEPSLCAENRNETAEPSWTGSLDSEDVREMTVAPIDAAPARGTATRESRVRHDGMTDWAPISAVPESTPRAELASAASVSDPAKNRLGGPSDDGEDETFIYRPGSKALPQATVGETELTSRVSDSAAKSHSDSRRADETVRGDAVVTRSKPRMSPGNRESPPAPASTTATSSEGRGGGPPPLRKVRLTPLDRQAPTHSAERAPTPPVALANADVVAQNATQQAKISAGGPPPLPIQRRAAEPVNAAAQSLADARDLVPREHSPASLPVLVAPEPLRLPPGAGSIPPTPSDIAALVRMRPKFPKWLPLAVLGGIVLIAATFAGLSWFAGDNVSDRGTTTATSDESALPLPAKATALVPAPSATGSVPEPTKPSENRDTSAGFASQFAQAVAKHKPTARFDRELAEKSLAAAFAKASACHNKGEPTGNASVAISISPSGHVLSVTVAPPFATTFTAECIRNALRDGSVPAFQGAPGRLVHSISIR